MRAASHTLTVIAVVALLIALIAGSVKVLTQLRTPSNADLPSGIWAGLIDDLPSGRSVECVMVRDPGGSVGITCDWNTAVTPRR